MIRRLLTSAALIALAAAVGIADEPATVPATSRAALPSAQQLIDRYIEATGGRAAYDGLTSRRAEGSFSMADLGVEGKMTVLIRADGDARVAIDIPGVGTLLRGVTNGVAWSLHPKDGPRILTGDEAVAAKASLALSPMISLAGYHDAQVTDIVALNGRPAYRMTLVTANDTTETRMYDVESGLIVRMISKSGSALGELTVTTNFTDYEDAPPIRLPLKVQQMLPGASPESAMTKVEHNIELPDELFALPAEVEALRRATTRPKER